jgi:abhydrolase domain-containing protein 1/3
MLSILTNIGTVSTAMTLSYYIYEYIRNVRKPDLYYQPNQKNDKIVTHIKDFEEYYWPTWWCHNKHVSTILGVVFRKGIDIPRRRNEFNLADGAKLYMDWFDHPSGREDLPLLLIIPGMNGTSGSNYVRLLIGAAHRKGFRCVVKNHRGTENIKFDKIKFNTTHSGDIRLVIQHLSSTYTNPLYAVGFSFGGNMLIKYLGEEGPYAKTKLKAAVSVSAPFDIYKSSDRIYSNPLYNYIFTEETKRTIFNMKEYYINLDHIRPEEIKKCKTLKELDEKITSPTYGFTNLQDFYNAFSSFYNIPNISIPMLLVNAKDDPVVAPDALPMQECFNNENTILCVVPKGGHIGFLEGVWPNGECWADKVVMEYLDFFLSKEKEE